MSPEEIQEIQVLQNVNNIKIERLEIEITKQQRILNEEIAALEEIKKKLLKARETYISEEKRTREEIQKESQTRSSLLQVKHYLTTLKDDIKRVKEEKENQKEVIIEVEKRIDELNRDMVKLQIKVEKFTSIIEE